ncbi:MAG: hypothetical protein RLZ22_1093 [Verrucomicrobiota bacterium]|jgi:hypothetical protein
MKTPTCITRLFIAACLSVTSLIASPEMVGEWITSYGRYSDTVTYKADGTFVSVTEVVRGSGAGEGDVSKISGTWKLVGDELSHSHPKGSYTFKIRMASPNSFENLSATEGEGTLYEKSGPANTAAPAAKSSKADKITEPKIGSPERKAIMDAMRGPVSKHAKTEVIFTGSAQVYQDWAKLEGKVSPKNGKPFSEDVIDEVELDFLAILRKIDGKWTTLYYGWSGDIGTRIEARNRFPDIPKALLPPVPN